MSPASNDLNILDAFGAIWKAKIWILVTMAAFGLIAFFVSLSRPPLHEAVAVVDVGRVFKEVSPQKADSIDPPQPQLELIENPDTIKTLLTSDWMLIALNEALGIRQDLKSLKRSITISGDLRKVEVIPELFLNISMKYPDAEKVKLGVEFLCRQLINHHEQYYEATLTSLNRRVKEMQQSIKSNQAQIKNVQSRIARTKDQINTDRKYLEYLTQQTPVLSTEIKESKSKFKQIKPNEINPSDIYYLQSNLQTQQDQYFNLNRELNDVSIRSQEREKQIDEMTSDITRLQSRNEVLRLRLDQYEKFKGALAKTSLKAPPFVGRENRKSFAMVGSGALIGAFFSLVVLLLIEGRKRFS
jgi:hypothetical protein